MHMNRITRTAAYFLCFLPIVVLAGLSWKIPGSSVEQFAAWLLFCMAAFFAAALIHEIGHLAAAFVFGWKLNAISVFPLVYDFADRKLRLEFRFSDGGYVSADVADGVVSNSRRVAIYAAAGPFANLIFGIPALVVASFSSTEAGQAICGSLGVTSLVLGLVNALPFQEDSGGWSDGAVMMSPVERIRKSVPPSSEFELRRTRASAINKKVFSWQTLGVVLLLIVLIVFTRSFIGPG
jgi:hypothetical protein